MSSLPRIAVLISGGGSNLQALIDAKIAANIELVISNKPAVKGLQRAQAANIETDVIEHKNYASREAFDVALAERLQQAEPDLIVLAGFMRILTPEFVTKFYGKLVNIHPSLLPKYQGLNTHQRALEAGDTEAGASIHFVSAELDGGPVIAQARVPVVNGDDAETLAARVLQVEHKLYPLVVRWLVEGRIELKTVDGIETIFLDSEELATGGRDVTGLL